MAVSFAKNKKTASATTRLVLAAFAGIVGGIIAGKVAEWYLAPLVGWDVAVTIYLGWMWATIEKLDDADTKEFALREDPSRRMAEFVLLGASIVSLAAVGLVLVGSGGVSDVTQTALRAGLSVFSVVLAWILTHTIFMLRYAELYYRGSKGGVEFAGTTDPTFRDFAYLAFTMGMTFQVSDTGFKSGKFRSIALRHALLSYLFGTVIVATTINLVAGLSK
ncbi:MAG TPA: DUF1345 domain-containing protein [Candidatus Microsaccharimonas sp.]|nr:DUF1345 domain-containing protein [Candidatus Microsaccharimonas sp.]